MLQPTGSMSWTQLSNNSSVKKEKRCSTYNREIIKCQHRRTVCKVWLVIPKAQRILEGREGALGNVWRKHVQEEKWQLTMKGVVMLWLCGPWRPFSAGQIVSLRRFCLPLVSHYGVKMDESASVRSELHVVVFANFFVKSRCLCVKRIYVYVLDSFIYIGQPGSPVLHYLPEFAQIIVHWIGDAILIYWINEALSLGNYLKTPCYVISDLLWALVSVKLSKFVRIYIISVHWNNRIKKMDLCIPWWMAP